MNLNAPHRPKIARKIRAAVPNCSQVLLFGSRARDDSRADRAIDLLVVLSDGTDACTASRRIRLALWGTGFGFDILSPSQFEFAQLRTGDSWYQRQIAAEAIQLDDAA